LAKSYRCTDAGSAKAVVLARQALVELDGLLAVSRTIGNRRIGRHLTPKPYSALADGVVTGRPPLPLAAVAARWVDRSRLLDITELTRITPA
jgi:hypothetical protein